MYNLVFFVFVRFFFAFFCVALLEGPSCPPPVVRSSIHAPDRLACYPWLLELIFSLLCSYGPPRFVPRPALGGPQGRSFRGAEKLSTPPKLALALQHASSSLPACCPAKTCWQAYWLPLPVGVNTGLLNFWPSGCWGRG